MKQADAGCNKFRKETYKVVTRWMRETQISFRPHAKKPGTKSHSRYDKYCKATTVGEALALGAIAEDWCWDYERGYIKVEGPLRDESVDLSKLDAQQELTEVDQVVLRFHSSYAKVPRTGLPNAMKGKLGKLRRSLGAKEEDKVEEDPEKADDAKDLEARAADAADSTPPKKRDTEVNEDEAKQDVFARMMNKSKIAQQSPLDRQHGTKAEESIATPEKELEKSVEDTTSNGKDAAVNGAERKKDKSQKGDEKSKSQRQSELKVSITPEKPVSNGKNAKGATPSAKAMASQKRKRMENASSAEGNSKLETDGTDNSDSGTPLQAWCERLSMPKDVLERLRAEEITRPEDLALLPLDELRSFIGHVKLGAAQPFFESCGCCKLCRG